MKCPICDGKGSVYNALGSFYEDCGHCQGTGMVRVEGEPMTEQEYLQTCTTEQLAEYLADKFNDVVDFVLHEVDENAEDIEPDDYWYRQDVIVEWLKQPHTPKESESCGT